MIVSDLIKICEEFLKLLSKYDIRVDDYKYTSLFSEYANMVAKGHKVSYIVAVLAERYKISEASVYRLLRKI